MSCEPAGQVMLRAELLAECSEEACMLTRRYGTPALREAASLIGGWMRAAGMNVREDAIGNVIGRCAPVGCGEAPALVLGSHLDTVRNAGRYDGALGILVALAAIELLQEERQVLQTPLEIYAFADEEGARFGGGYLASRAAVGTLGPEELDRADADGVRLVEAIEQYGGRPDELGSARRDPSDLLGYLEVHIEQGPVLEARGIPVGVVNAIVGQSRCEITFTGKAGHAGTVPMDLRRDALCGAADLILLVERAALNIDGLVATIGQLRIEPGVANVIPERVKLLLDVRHPEDTIRRAALRVAHNHAREIAAARRLDLTADVVFEQAAVECSEPLRELLSQTVADLGYEPLTLDSGAGHDACAMAAITPAAMLFVRCEGGHSHTPEEAVDEADVAVAIDVVRRFVLNFAADDVPPSRASAAIEDVL